MKKIVNILVILALLLGWTSAASAQNGADTAGIMHKIIKQNGVAFTGKILTQDSREILMDTKELGLVYIPKHEVREIIEVRDQDKSAAGGLFSTRYFLTTNGFPVAKGDNYVQWNLFGPDFQFGIADNFGVGIMTSWVGMPIIGTAKYSVKFSDGFHGGLGFLGGTGSWAYPKYGLVLPFGFLTFGSRTNNINISAGYGALFSERNVTSYTLLNVPTEYSTNSYTSVNSTQNKAEGRVLISVAGMLRLNAKFSLVLDSFIMLPGKGEEVQYIQESYHEITRKATYSLKTELRNHDPLIVLAPGLRFQATENSSFQFGFTGVHYQGEFVPVPIPLVQWFRKI